jgi:mannosyltransferase OCH1-like enzyme
VTIQQALKAALLDLPFLPIHDQKSQSRAVQNIPPIVFQTWEKNAFGRRHRNSIIRFRKINSDLDFILLDSSARDSYMRERWGNKFISKIYFEAKFGALRADIFRYCILMDRGGYYFDISKGLEVKITSLHDHSISGAICFEKNLSDFHGPMSLTHPRNLVVQWGLGFVSNHPLLKNHIERIEWTYSNFFGKTFANPKQAILEFTGPIAFTKTVHEYAETNGLDDIAQLGIDFFGYGIFSLNGSESRYAVSPSYSRAKNKKILTRE